MCQKEKAPCSGEPRSDCQDISAKDCIDREMAQRAVEAVATMDVTYVNNIGFNFNNFSEQFSPDTSSRSSSSECESDNGSLVINEDVESADQVTAMVSSLGLQTKQTIHAFYA